jgi:hypothetical protein
MLQDEDIECLFLKHREHIKDVKSQILPFLEDVEEERYFVEEARKHDQIDTDTVGNQLAAGKEQDNLDTLNEEIEDNADFQHLDPCLLQEQSEERFKVTEYGRIIVPNKKVLCETTRRLDKDQRRVVDKVVTYCKDLCV